MKKIKFLGAVVLAASLILAGCANGSDDEAEPTPAAPVETPANGENSGSGENTGSETNSGTNTGSEENSGAGQNAGSGENTGSTGNTGSDNSSSGSNSGSSESGENTGSNTENGSGSVDEDDEEYTLEFSDAANSSICESGVYIVSVANANDSEWGNQIFIKNPNAAAGIAAGDKIHTTITLEADKDIGVMFVKNQFNGGSYSGIDTQKGLPANTATVFDIYGTVAADYDDSSSIVLALRGNAADTELKISAINVEKLTDYAITSLVVSSATDSVAAGETTTLTAKDQYGFVVVDAEFEITSENPASSISGNVLTAGDTAEEITVVAKNGEITSEAVTINITADKDFGKFFKAGSQTSEADLSVPGYMALWYVADLSWNCGSVVTVSDVAATSSGYSITRNVIGENTWSPQLFYKEIAGTYTITFKIKSTAAGDVTINGNNISLSADVEYEYTEEKTLEEFGTLISIQIGGEAGILPAGEFTITDFSVSAAE